MADSDFNINDHRKLSIVPPDFDQCLSELTADDRRTRWNAVVKLARHPKHPRWYEAWQAIEKRLDTGVERHGQYHEQDEMTSQMAIALSMISARNAPPGGILEGMPIPDFLVTFEEWSKGTKRNPTDDDWLQFSGFMGRF